MNDFPPAPPTPRSPLYLVAIVGSSLLAIVGVVVFVVAAYHQQIEQRRLADEQLQLQKSEQRAKVYLDAARANGPLLEARMLVERPRRIAKIASQTGLPLEFVDEYFGWFTGLNDPTLYWNEDSKIEVENIPPALWACREELESKYRELNPKEIYDPFEFRTVSKRFAQMTTDRAVRDAIRTSSTMNRTKPNPNPLPRETKYDVSSGSNQYDDFRAYIVLMRDMPFAWLIEREHAGSGDGNLDMAASRAVAFLSEAVDRRIDFVIHGIVPPKVEGPSAKP